MSDFAGKVVLITGGSRGLGAAMSRGFAAQGARVVIASRKLESCEALAEEIRAAGGDALAVAAHMGSIEDLDRLVETTLTHYGQVDILINNAGINVAYGELSSLDPAAYDKMYEVNQRGPWYLASRLAPKMGESGGGAIINPIFYLAGESYTTGITLIADGGLMAKI